MTEPRRVRTQVERDADGVAWRQTADTRPGYATWPQTAPGNPSWWRRDAPDAEPTFEDVLSDPRRQFDPDDELLPHLLAFGQVRDDRPWLFQPVADTTAVPVDGETCAKWCGFCHLGTGVPAPTPAPPPFPGELATGGIVPGSAGSDLVPIQLGGCTFTVPPRRRWWHRLTRRAL